jgi:NadR type nicotinamide-nucleotide adenylyltransferase
MDIKKIAVIGPESTGKSTLSEALAKHLHTVWVPEYARAYLDSLHRPYAEEDLLIMAQGQLQYEDALAHQANEYLVCDTDLHVIKVWSEHKYHRCNTWIDLQITKRKYDLYLLTYIDTTWEPDSQREHPEPAMREHFYNLYLDIVRNSGVPWADIRGSHEQRLQTALQAINSLI